MIFDLQYSVEPMDAAYLACQNTPLSEKDATYFLKCAWKHIYGTEPSVKSLAILWAQTALESGRYRSLRNYNYGNIKKKDDIEYYTSYECGEYLEGKYYKFFPYHPETFFAAWKDPLAGAIGYINFLSQRVRYRKAWIELQNGDPVKYCIGLKTGGYFTEPLESYTGKIVSLMREFILSHQENPLPLGKG